MDGPPPRSRDHTAWRKLRASWASWDTGQEQPASEEERRKRAAKAINDELREEIARNPDYFTPMVEALLREAHEADEKEKE